MCNQLLAGFDIGTSKIRCFIYNLVGDLKFSSSHPTPFIAGGDGFSYNPAEHLWTVSKLVFRECVEYSKKNNLQIISLAVSSVGESGIAIDKNKEILFDAIPWYDQRTEIIRDEFEKKTSDTEIYNNTGLNSDHIFGAYKLLWIKKYKPDIFNKIFKWLPISDFIAWKFSGRIATDYSQAMRTMLLDPRTLSWSDFMCAKIGINKELLPSILPSGTELGPLKTSIVNEFDLGNDCTVGVGGHDHIVGTFGVRGFNSNVIVNSMGSAEAIIFSTKDLIKSEHLSENKFISGVFKTPKKSSYYVIGSLLTSSLVIEWLKEILKIDDYRELEKTLVSAAGVKKNIFFFPQFEFPHSPSKEKYTSGALWGLSLNTSQGDLYKSVLECLAFDTKNALNFLCSTINQKADKIICVGGGSKNDTWMRIRADVFNHEIHINSNSENVSLGSAILAGIAAKVYGDEDEAFKKIKIEEKVIPFVKNAESVLYEKIFVEKYIPNIELIKKLNQRQL